MRNVIVSEFVSLDLVTIRYPRLPSCDWLNYRTEHPAEVEFDVSIGEQRKPKGRGRRHGNGPTP